MLLTCFHFVIFQSQVVAHHLLVRYLKYDTQSWRQNLRLLHTGRVKSVQIFPSLKIFFGLICSFCSCSHWPFELNNSRKCKQNSWTGTLGEARLVTGRGTLLKSMGKLRNWWNYLFIYFCEPRSICLSFRIWIKWPEQQGHCVRQQVHSKLAWHAYWKHNQMEMVT